MLSVSEKYMVEQTLVLYNQILFTKFYNLIWKGQSIMAAWDIRNEILVSLIIGYLNEEETAELSEIIYDRNIMEIEDEAKAKAKKKEAEAEAKALRDKLIREERLRREEKKKKKDLTNRKK